MVGNDNCRVLAQVMLILNGDSNSQKLGEHEVEHSSDGVLGIFWLANESQQDACKNAVEGTSGNQGAENKRFGVELQRLKKSHGVEGKEGESWRSGLEVFAQFWAGETWGNWGR